MPDPVLPRPRPDALDQFLRDQARALRGKDQPPKDRAAWDRRRGELVRTMQAALGPAPAKPCDLSPRILGTLKRQGYRIEKLLFQSRPDVWVTANAYVPDVKGRVPAVLVVHGHWPGARRDPVVQARCLGLVKLGFFALAVDAFGAGERYTAPAVGTYHGALYGSTLWPTGHTLLGMQVYDNRRAVDYLRTRPEVDGERLGVTGASGGGNQSMYAGALDERLRAVVPVCSVGTYNAYLHAACCVCEVLPGALRFAEEGDVLALVAPRALLVISATRDAFQFSVGEATRSIARARPVFRLLDADDRLRHATFESGHAYNQPMREAMYGWMTRWLKNEGAGKPIAEPKHEVEKPEALACFPDGKRPKEFLLLPAFAGREGRALVARLNAVKADHVEDWDSAAVHMRTRLRRDVLGDFPPAPKPAATAGKPRTDGAVRTTPLVFHPEADLPVPALLRQRVKQEDAAPACVLLHLDGKGAALDHPLAAALETRGWAVLAPDLRGTGETRRANDAIRQAPDHTSAEHALWVGRPLLGQWVLDVQCLLDWLAAQRGLDRRRFAVVGVGQAGIVALCASALLDDRVTAAAALGTPVSYITDREYAPGTRMGLLAPGILRVADVPHLAALSAPRRLVIAEGVSPQGKRLAANALQEAFAFTRSIYRLHRLEKRLTLAETARVEDVAAAL
ncbi:MAG: acetylxylan esterase [Gemmataceae bacterium]|nr:acetylxylan esterase [Gemmataceae bacterium]